MKLKRENLYSRSEKKEKSSKKGERLYTKTLMVKPEMVGVVLFVYQGKSFKPIRVKEHMVGFRIGRFCRTRKPNENLRTSKKLAFNKIKKKK